MNCRTKKNSDTLYIMYLLSSNYSNNSCRYGWSMNDEKKNMIHQYLIIIYIWSAFHKLLVILPSNHFPSMRNAHGLYKHKMVHYGHLRVKTLLRKKNFIISNFNSLEDQATGSQQSLPTINHCSIVCVCCSFIQSSGIWITYVHWLWNGPSLISISNIELSNCSIRWHL